MCGIVGVITREPLSDESLSRVTCASDYLVHRGPDGFGNFQYTHVALAMRRLSIIDPKGGQQPLYNEDGSLVLIANGEIYNFIELRDGLRAQGHRFRTGSDCEVIVHLYEEYGLECVHHLRGMFAFALWDRRRRVLVLARDRMGEKPLYLYEQNGQLYFASELKALVRSGCVPFELDPTTVDLFFHYNYVPEPMTPIQGVCKLAAAHMLTVHVDTWEHKESCYWRMEDAPPLTGNPAELIRSELESISELIVRSDVPVGIALSGGLDSSAIAALTSRKYPGAMQAFSVGYQGCKENDERADAKALAELLGMPFHEVEVRTADFVKIFPELVYWHDDPIGDISGYGYYSVMKAAKAHGVSVMLQGHGGDELFWGYPWVREAVDQTQRKMSSWDKGAPRFLDYLSLTAPQYWSLWGVKEWVKSFAGLRKSWELYDRDRSSPKNQAVFYDLTPDFCMAHEALPGMYTPDFLEQLQASRAFEVFTPPTPWPQLDLLMTRLICQTYLLENGIAQGDRLSMASSVELRLPLVDYRLVETVIGLRKARSDHKLPPKAWLRAALKDVLPEWVLKRPKRGFTPPIREWHQAVFSAHGAELEDGILVKSGVLHASAGRMLAKGPFPVGAGSPMSFKALTLELWCKQLAAPSRHSRLHSVPARADSPHVIPAQAASAR